MWGIFFPHFLVCLPLCALKSSMTWHCLCVFTNLVCGLVHLVHDLRYSCVHEPLAQKQEWMTTSVQCGLSDRVFPGKVNMQASLFFIFFFFFFWVVVMVVVVRSSAFNVVLQTEKESFILYKQFPPPDYFHPSLDYMNLCHPDGKSSKMYALNYQSVIKRYCPRWMAFCKSTLSSGLHDGKAGFWHF